MQLFLIRHPQPLVAPGICYGCSDLTVDPAEQARVAAALLSELPADAALISSPLQRCAGLARELAVTLGISDPNYDARLAELDFGTWEMRAWGTIPCVEVDAWANDIVGYRPGGGESVLQMAQRVHAFHTEILLGGALNVVVVCHAGTIRLLQACQHGLTPAEMAREAAKVPNPVPFGGLIRINC